MSNPWNGEPLTLGRHDAVTMPQTPNSSTVLVWRNDATQGNDGQLALTSGGGPPEILNAPALTGVPSFLARNWQANYLTITNISVTSDTPIWIQMFGPGLTGEQPKPLTIGVPTPLDPLQTAQGRTDNFMQLALESNTGDLTTIAVLGGPADSQGNNAYLFALNYAGTPPPGYTAVTTGNTLTYEFNWGTALIFVANLSGDTGAPLQVLLRSL